MITEYEELGLENNQAFGKSTAILKKKNKVNYFFAKRIFDILFGMMGCAILIPTSIFIKIISILSGDFKPIFYSQIRIGKNGKKFKLYKYRTMIPDADKVLEELLKNKKYKEEWNNNQKLNNDPRITKVGRLLRKISLDELPQFINVFKGDMSLIGPRPLVEGELDAHSGNHAIYESVRPGISGWWASHGRSATTYEKRLELEYFYCKNCNLILDIKCVFATIKAIISKKGAK